MDLGAYNDASVTLMVDLLNTHDVCSDPAEKLVDVPALEEFLHEHGMLGTDPPTRRDLDEIRALRDRMRTVVEASGEPETLDRLNAVLADAGMVPRVVSSGGGREIRYAPPDAPLARQVACDAGIGLAMMLVDHSERLKMCTAAPCQDVFVDMSRNKCRRYCSDTCGSRATVAAYRERQRRSATV